MKPADILIRGRDYILDRLVGSGPSLVLNRHPPKGSSSQSAAIAAIVKQTLDDLKALAMDESGTRIDYAALRTNPAYIEYQETCLPQLQQFKPQDLSTVNARRAFWINLYNALVIDAVIAFNVQGSVIEGLLGPLAFFRRAAYRIDGKRVSLDDIEHGILRGNRGHPLLPGPHFPSDDPRLEWMLPLDPRIHFALNCGGRSCPPIRSYGPEKLNAQLDLAARSFVNANVAIRSGEICLSRLFHWYRADFAECGGVRYFLVQYLNDDRHRESLRMERGAPRFRYTPYDWGLNALRSTSR